MAYEKQIEDFAENKATWVSYSDLPLMHTRQLVRGWRAVSDVEKAANEAYLNAYVSPKNASPSSTITDPQADGCGTLEGGLPKNVFPGLWRHVSTGWNRQDQLYMQTLRFGWASTVLTGGGPNDECMIRDANDTREDSRVYEFYWRNISEASVNACVSALRTQGSFTNPTVQGESKPGTYAFASIVAEQFEDGSYIIRVQSIKVADVTDATDLDALYPIKRFLHVIENPFGLEGLYTEHVGRKPTDGIVYTYRALSKDSETAIRAITDAEFQARLSTDDKAKYEFVKSDLVEDSGNTLKLELTYQYVPLVTTTPEENARLVGEVRFNQSGKLALTRSWPRIDPAVADTLLVTNVNTAVTAETVTSPQAEGKIYAGDWLVIRTYSQMTDNDGLRIVQELIKSGDQKLYIKVGTDPLHLTCEFKLWDASVEAIEAFLADPDPFGDASVDPAWETPELGITKIVRTQANADRSIDLHAVYNTTENLDRLQLFDGGTPGFLTVRDTYGVRTERGFGYNVPVAELKLCSDYYNPTVDVVNVKREFKINRRDEHTFDFEGVVVTYSPTDHGDVVIEQSDEKLVTRRVGEYITALLMAPDAAFGRPTVAVDGTLVELEQKANDVGTYSVVKTTTVTHDQTATAEGAKGTVELFEQVEHTATATPAEPDAVATNRESKATNTPRADGLTKTSKVTTTAVPVAIASAVLVASDAFKTDTMSLLLNQTSVDPAATNEKVELKHNGLGGLDVARVLTTEVDAVSTGGADTIVEGATVVEHAAVASEPAVPTSGVNEQAVLKSKVTPGGNFNTVLETVTKRPATVVDEVQVAADAFKTDTMSLLLNQTSVTPAATNEKVELKHNGLGGVDVVRVLTAETDAVSTGGTDSVVEATEVVEHAAVASEPAVPTSGVNEQAVLKSKVTPGGNFNTVLETVTKKPVTVVNGVQVAADAFKTDTMSLLLNQTSVTPAATNEKVELKHNGVGGVDVVRVLTDEVDATAMDVLSSAGVTVTTEKHVAKPAQETGGATVIGQVQTVTNKPTAGGNFETAKSTEVWAQLEADGGGGMGSASTVVSSVVVNGTAGLGVDPPTINVKQEVENKRDPKTGAFNSVKVLSTAESVDTTPFVHKDDGIHTLEKRLLFNQTAVPDATAHEVVEASHNGLGGWDIVKIKTALADGFSVRTTHQSSVINWSNTHFQEKIPAYTQNTNPLAEYQNGWNIYMFFVSRAQKIDTVVTRTFTLSMPSAGTAVSTSSGEGGGTNQTRDVVPVAENLWCEEIKTVTTEPYGTPSSTVYFIGFVPLTTPG